MSRFPTGHTATIVATEDTSSGFSPRGHVYGSIDVSGLSDIATLTVEVQLEEGGDWLEVFDEEDAAYTISVVAGAKRIPDACFPCHAMRFVGDTTETAGATMTVYLGD